MQVGWDKGRCSHSFGLQALWMLHKNESSFLGTCVTLEIPFHSPLFDPKKSSLGSLNRMNLLRRFYSHWDSMLINTCTHRFTRLV